MAPDFILASTSATRQDMLRAAGVPFTARSPMVDEAAIKQAMTGESPAIIAMALAEAKALAVSGRHPDAIVLGADQTLDLDGALFDKPTSAEDAHRQLKALAGKTHRLETAAALARDGAIIWRCARQARLTMRIASDDFLRRYITSQGDGITSSVGGYKIEGPALQLFSAIDGNHFVILGLPLVELCEELRGQGVLDT
jgi:septum formation protein